MRREFPRVAALACGLVLIGCGGGDEDTPDGSGEDGAEEPAAALPPEEDIEAAGAERLKVSGDHLAAGGDAAWANWEATIVRVDADSGVQTDEIRIPEQPCGGSTFADGALWTQTCGSLGLARVDAKTLDVTHVALDASRAYNGNATIDAGEGAVWLVADGKGCEACVLLGVDPGSLDVSHEIEITPGGSSVAVGLGSVWVSNPKDGSVARIDPTSGELLSETPVEGSPQYVTVGEGSAWVFDQLGGNVVELDAEGEQARVIEADMAGAGGSITTGEGSVWVSGALTLLEEIDAETGEVIARYGPRSGGGDVLVTNGAVWVSRFQEDFEDILRLPIPAP